MAIWIVKGDTKIGYHLLPERKKPVLGITKENIFIGYGQLRDEESAEEFMNELAEFFNAGHGHWEDGVCSNCGEEALSTSRDEPIYDYDWEENLRYSHTETHTEYHLTNYCPNCGAKMDGGNSNGVDD